MTRDMKILAELAAKHDRLIAENRDREARAMIKRLEKDLLPDSENWKEAEKAARAAMEEAGVEYLTGESLPPSDSEQDDAEKRYEDKVAEVYGEDQAEAIVADSDERPLKDAVNASKARLVEHLRQQFQDLTGESLPIEPAGMAYWLTGADAPTIPQWMERPSEPGRWIFVSERSGLYSIDTFTKEDIDDGGPFHVKAVYGPIPEQEATK